MPPDGVADATGRGGPNGELPGIVRGRGAPGTTGRGRARSGAGGDAGEGDGGEEYDP